jgi:hypothetical protein
MGAYPAKLLRRVILVASMILSIATGHGVAGEVTIEEHFLGKTPVCLTKNMPVLLVTDVTLRGEIDDTVTLHIYRRLEEIGCVKILAVVSIFGNGGSSTSAITENLRVRLAELGISKWPIMEGPHRRLPFSQTEMLTEGDTEKLRRIALVIGAHKKVDIAELGPFTVSAGLLMKGLVKSGQISRILGVGGRSRHEQFAPKKNVPFAFRDMNVAEDRQAMNYLVRAHASKLRLVTWRTGIGARSVKPIQLAPIGKGMILSQAWARSRRMKLIGYGGRIPIWDTWTAAFFVLGGMERLGCVGTPVRMMHEETGFKPSDSMQLRLLDSPDSYSTRVVVCHAFAAAERL